MAYDIKRSNDAFVILHNASAVCSLAFWFLELQQYLATVLLPGKKFTSENTQHSKVFEMTQFSKAAAVTSVTLHHFVLQEYISAIHYIVVCIYLPHLHMEQG